LFQGEYKMRNKKFKPANRAALENDITYGLGKKDVTNLDLSRVGADVEQYHLAMQSEGYNKLKSLNVSNANLYQTNGLTQDISGGLTHLLKANPGLEYLNVSDCPQADDAFAATLPKYNKLKEINTLRNYGMTPLGILALRQVAPYAEITTPDGDVLSSTTRKSPRLNPQAPQANNPVVGQHTAALANQSSTKSRKRSRSE